MATRARAEDHQHALSPGGKMRRPSPQWRGRIDGGPQRSERIGAQQPVARKQVGQCDAAQTGAGMTEKTSAVEQATSGVGKRGLSHHPTSKHAVSALCADFQFRYTNSFALKSARQKAARP